MVVTPPVGLVRVMSLAYFSGICCGDCAKGGDFYYSGLRVSMACTSTRVFGASSMLSYT